MSTGALIEVEGDGKLNEPQRKNKHRGFQLRMDACILLEYFFVYEDKSANIRECMKMFSIFHLNLNVAFHVVLGVKN